VGGGIGGFFPIGGGGFGLPPTNSGAEAVDIVDVGRRLSLSADTAGLSLAAPPGGRGGAPGGFGAAPVGGLAGKELRDDSGSDIYGDWASAPVFTPPALRSFGMPPAKSPPSCGAALIVEDRSLAPSPPVSLLLLARFPGTGGASPPGGAGGALPIPGTDGATPIGGAAGPSETLPTIGADRSLTIVTFFSLAPLVMSPRSAP
jgi:hypothetical protein